MRIDELQLLTQDVDAQRGFYAAVLGLPVLAGEAGSLVLGAGSSQLVFAQAPDGWSGIYHFAFNIPENRFKEAKEWVSRRVELIRSNAGEDEFNFEHWNAHALYFYDPAGNIVEFIARHDRVEEASAESFSERSILSVSEIGVATDDVPGTVRLIESGTGVGTYDGAGSDMFTAVGDPHGLFIVVKNGRTWFPDTGRQAALLPVRVAVTADGGERYVLSGLPYEIRAGE